METEKVTDQQPAADEPRITNTELVYRAIVDCREQGEAATRHSVAKRTGLAVAAVDDRVKYLRSVGQIRLAGGHVHGVYEPTEERKDDRAVSGTILPNGRVKFEIGEFIVEMTQREAKHAGALLGGLALLVRA
jgi:hypothetical protein